MSRQLSSLRRHGPVDPVTGGRNLGPIGEQIRQTLRSMAHMLESAGSSLRRIVKVTIVPADIADRDICRLVHLLAPASEIASRSLRG